MKERFISAFEETLAANKGGEVKNLLVTDNIKKITDPEAFLLELLNSEEEQCVDTARFYLFFLYLYGVFVCEDLKFPQCKNFEKALKFASFVVGDFYWIDMTVDKMIAEGYTPRQVEELLLLVDDPEWQRYAKLNLCELFLWGRYENFDMVDFERAMEIIPEAFVRYGESPDGDIFMDRKYFFKRMKDFGYSAEDIERFILKVIETDKQFAKILFVFYKTGKYDDVEIPELMNEQKAIALEEKYETLRDGDCHLE